MKRSTIVFSLFASLFVMATALRADMGSVWVKAVSHDEITIQWNGPESGSIHALATDKPLYRISWEAVDPYNNGYPLSSNTSKVLAGEEGTEFTLTGLMADTYYRVKVEAFAMKRNTYGEWVNADFRQIGWVKQKTHASPFVRNVRVAQTARETITVEFTNAEPEAFDVVLFVYKQKWSSVPFSEIVGTALADESNWGDSVWPQSDETSGAVKKASESSVEATFFGLSQAQAYEIAVFGYKLGTSEGVRLGRASARTGGYQPMAKQEDCLTADYQEVLNEYGIRVSAGFSGLPLINIVCQDFAQICEDIQPVVEDDEGENLGNNLTALLFLIDGYPEIFSEWQDNQESRGGVTLEGYLVESHGKLHQRIHNELDVVPTLFRRGDANTDGIEDLSDAVAILDFLFKGGKRLYCLDAADSNDDGEADLSDVIHLLGSLFRGTEDPKPPFGYCGVDPSEDELGCEEYNMCTP